MNIGTNLKRIREARGINRQQLSYDARVPVQTILRLESGAATNPALGPLVRLADALGIEISELIGEKAA